VDQNYKDMSEGSSNSALTIHLDIYFNLHETKDIRLYTQNYKVKTFMLHNCKLFVIREYF